MSVLWDTYKAVIGGHCIAILICIKKRCGSSVMYDSKLTVRLTKRTLRQILELRTLALGKTEKLPLYSRQWYYDSANRAHIKLAKMPRDETAQRNQYYSLKYSEDTVVYDPEAEAMNFFCSAIFAS